MHANRVRPGAAPGPDREDEAAEQLKVRKPAGGEPIHDEEMFVAPLAALINSGHEPKNPPAGG